MVLVRRTLLALKGSHRPGNRWGVGRGLFCRVTAILPLLPWEGIELAPVLPHILFAFLLYC